MSRRKTLRNIPKEELEAMSKERMTRSLKEWLETDDSGGKRYVYLNFTNGLKALPILEALNISPHFCCFQPTHLEQKHIDELIQRIDCEMMMHLALGDKVLVVDYGCFKDRSRAVYQGVPFIKYVLERKWFGHVPDRVDILPRYNDALPLNVTREFNSWYRNLSRPTKAYLDKFKEYANLEEAKVHLYGISALTIHDGNKGYYAEILDRSRFGHEKR